MPERFNKAIIIGDACLDLHLKMNDLIAELEVTPYRMVMGGTCASCAGTLARLGSDTAFLGTVGEDFGGRQIIKTLKELGIDTSMTIVKKDLNTVNILAFIDPEGERHLWGFPRVDQAYCELDMNEVDPEKIKTASWLHSSGMAVLADGSMQEALPELYRLAYEAEVPTSLDLNTRVSDLSLLSPKAVASIEKILPYVKYLLGSAKDEFYSFYPCDNWKDSARHFANNDRVVIARNGKDGFLVLNGGEESFYPTYEVEAINTTGAGDSFNAGFISAMLEGKNIDEALRFANAVSAYKISRESQDEDLNKELVETFMKQHKLREI